MNGQFKMNYEWVGELSDCTTRKFNELSDFVQITIRQLLSDDVKYVKKTEVSFR